MSSSSEPATPFAIPRPGVVKALGICNIVFAVLSMVCIFSSAMMVYAASSVAKDKVGVTVVKSAAPANRTGSTATPAVPFNPFMGFEDANFLRFSVIESAANLVINGLMFATGIGLLNLRRWAARGWGWVAWVRIVSVVLVWGWYILGVAPGFSETMAKDVAAQFAQQGLAANRVPQVSQLTRVYSIMNLIVALGAMVVTSIYPAISLWLLSRPGVKAAIVDKPALEHEQP